MHTGQIGTRVILTDIGRVWAIAEDRAEAVRRFLAAHGADPDEVVEFFPELRESRGKKPHQYISADLLHCTLTDLWVFCLSKTNIPSSLISKEVFIAYLLNTIKFYPPVLKVLQRIQKQGVKLAVVSDGDEYSLYSILLAEVRHQVKFDHKFVSSDYNLLKPELLRAVVKELKERDIKAEDCIFVDDKKQLCLVAQERFGMNCVVFDAGLQQASSLERVLTGILSGTARSKIYYAGKS